jgi:hypothetical protein
VWGLYARHQRAAKQATNVRRGWKCAGSVARGRGRARARAPAPVPAPVPASGPGSGCDSHTCGCCATSSYTLRSLAFGVRLRLAQPLVRLLRYFRPLAALACLQYRPLAYVRADGLVTLHSPGAIDPLASTHFLRATALGPVRRARRQARPLGRLRQDRKCSRESGQPRLAALALQSGYLLADVWPAASCGFAQLAEKSRPNLSAASGTKLRPDSGP